MIGEYYLVDGNGYGAEDDDDDVDYYFMLFFFSPVEIAVHECRNIQCVLFGLGR